MNHDTMQYFMSKMQVQDEYGNLDLAKVYQSMATIPVLRQYLPAQYDVYRTETHYCIDIETEMKLQKQRQFTYMFASPLLIYAGIKLGGKVGTTVSLLGLACGLTHYAQHQSVQNAPLKQ